VWPISLLPVMKRHQSGAGGPAMSHLPSHCRSQRPHTPEQIWPRRSRTCRVSLRSGCVCGFSGWPAGWTALRRCCSGTAFLLQSPKERMGD